MLVLCLGVLAGGFHRLKTRDELATCHRCTELSVSLGRLPGVPRVWVRIYAAGPSASSFTAVSGTLPSRWHGAGCAAVLTCAMDYVSGAANIGSFKNQKKRKAQHSTEVEHLASVLKARGSVPSKGRKKVHGLALNTPPRTVSF